MTRIRKIACPELQTVQGTVLTQQVVEVSNGKVVDYYPLTKELPFTEWTSSRLRLCENEEGALTLWNHKEPII
jgi:hypothetical protein